jgi:predicted MFS family arabinose efflux permease
MPASRDPPIWPFYFGIFLSPLAGSGVIAILAALRGTFAVGVSAAGLTITAYMVPYAAFQLVSGVASDVYGRRRTLGAGFLVFAAGSAAAGLAPTFLTHLAGRALQGGGAAFVTPVVLAVLGELSARGKRGAVMGNLGMGVTTAVVAGPLVAGAVSVAFGWRWFFAGLAVAAVASAGLYGALLPRDLRGGDAAEVRDLLAAAVGRSDVQVVAAGGFLSLLAHIGLLTYASETMATAPLGLAEDRVGLALSLGATAGFVASPGGGRLADRWGRPRAIAAGFGLQAVGGLALAGAALAPSYGAFVAALLVANAGFYAQLAGLNAASVELMPEARGTPTSIYNFLRFAGYGLAPVAFAPVFARAGMGAVGLVGALVAGVGVLVTGLVLARVSQRT